MGTACLGWWFFFGTTLVGASILRVALRVHLLEHGKVQVLVCEESRPQHHAKAHCQDEAHQGAWIQRSNVMIKFGK